MVMRTRKKDEEPEVPELNLISAEDTENVYYKFFLWGLSGAGKTHCASLAPGCLYIPLESQAIPTVRRVSQKFGGTAKLPFGDSPVNSLEELFEITKAAKSGRLAEMGIKTLVFDSINELQRMLMDAITKSKKKNKDVFSMADYGTLGLRMHKFLRNIRDLPMNVILIGLCEIDNTGDARIYSPTLKGSVRHELAGYFNAAGYVYKADGEHFVMFDGGEEFTPVKPFDELTGIVVPDPSLWIRFLNGEDVDINSDDTRGPKKPSGSGGRTTGRAGSRSRKPKNSDEPEDDDDEDDESEDGEF